MSKAFFTLMLATLMPISYAFSAGPLSSEIERVKGFDAYQRFLKQYDDVRESGANQISKKRVEWEANIEAAIPQQKALKAKEVQALDDDSPQALEDLRLKEAEDKKHQQLANEYAADKKRQQAGFVNLLSEAKEYGLEVPPERFDWKKRALYGAPGLSGTAGKGGGSSGRSATSGFTRPSDFSTAPEGQDFGAPPPPPPTQSGFDGNNGPDFFEPDIPPPPMPEGGMEDEIPPPIFDEPEF